MGLISYTALVDNSTAVNAASVNNPLNTIYNEFNGNITNANISSSAAISTSKIDLFSSTGAGAVWQQELGRTTLSVSSDTISLSFTAKKYMRLIFTLIPTGGTIGGIFRYNSDSGANYAHAFSQDGGADAGSVSQTSHPWDPTAAAAVTVVGEFDIINFTAQEKQTYGYTMSSGAAGAAQIGSRRDWHYKWANTSAQITSVTVSNTGTGDFAIGSEVIVLGHD